MISGHIDKIHRLDETLAISVHYVGFVMVYRLQTFFGPVDFRLEIEASALGVLLKHRIVLLHDLFPTRLFTDTQYLPGFLLGHGLASPSNTIHSFLGSSSSLCIDDGLAVGLDHGPADDGAAHDEELPKEPSGHIPLVLFLAPSPSLSGGGGNPRRAGAIRLEAGAAPVRGPRNGGREGEAGGF